MHLLDKVAQARDPLILALPGTSHAWPLPGCNIVAQQVRCCPLRYVLRDDLTEQCTELAFETDTILATCAEILRVPVPSMWIEFCGRARQRAFLEQGRLGLATADSAQHVGLLVSSDPSGRKGKIDVCWDTLEGHTADLSPCTIEFDFDDPSFSQLGDLVSADGAIGVDVPGDPALQPLFSRVRFIVRPEWQCYFSTRTGSEHQYRNVLRQAILPLLEDVPFFATFCLLVMARTALAERQICLARLNRARDKRRAFPLLDHIELSMKIAATADTRKGPAHLRGAPRLHLVRGHLVHRGESVFWRTCHMRGRPELGSIRSRTVCLHLGGGKAAARAAAQ